MITRFVMHQNEISCSNTANLYSLSKAGGSLMRPLTFCIFILCNGKIFHIDLTLAAQ